MIRSLTAVSAVLALSLGAAACHKSGENAGNDVSNPGQSAPVNTVQDVAGAQVGAVSGAVNNDTAAEYVPAAAIGDMYEIEAGKIAAQRAKDPKVKSFAAMMVKDHTKSSADMKAALAAAGVTVAPPAAMDERRKGMIDNLKAAGDTDFDLAYLHQQAAAHIEAHNLHKGYSEHGDNEALKAVAGKIAPVVQMHIDHLKEIGGDKLKDAFPGGQ